MKIKGRTLISGNSKFNLDRDRRTHLGRIFYENNFFFRSGDLHHDHGNPQNLKINVLPQLILYFSRRERNKNNNFTPSAMNDSPNRRKHFAYLHSCNSPYFELLDSTPPRAEPHRILQMSRSKFCVALARMKMHLVK